jgi:CHAT domain-containing protein
LAALRRAAANGLPGDFDGMMDRLGQRLLSPFGSSLPQVIYFFPAGRMEGFPLDALRWNGEFLAAGHRVVNLLSLAGPGTGDPVVSSRDLQRFFLAGNRQEGAGDFDLLKPPSTELTEIADLFVGPGLHIVQGSALQWDEFQDERFNLAGVVHLAMPGIIDLRDPRQSQLLLSDNAANPAHAMLRAQDVSTKKFSAALVVLSACDFVGINPSAFDQNSRFIPDFLRAGADAVIASLWNVGDLQAAGFMQHFYRQLMVTPNVGDALAAAKREYLTGKKKTEDAAWATFQLFVK